MRCNSLGQRIYYEAVSKVQEAKAAESVQNYQHAIVKYAEAINKCKAALSGNLSEQERKTAQDLIGRASIRIQELQIAVNNPIPNSNPGSGRISRPQSQTNKYLQSGRPKSQQNFKSNQLALNSHSNNFQQSNQHFQNQYQQQQIQNQQQMMQMNNAIMHERPNMKFSDVAGLNGAKQALSEAVLLPLKLPGLFTGATKPWRGILLYGPPGTGKSYLAKALAGEGDNFTFLTVSTADLTSKWVGESEKLIKSLFETARNCRPSVVFIDEIDSLVSERGESDSESGRRIKTEFLIQMDGVNSNNDGIVIIGATNLPWGLDPAILRRFEKRIYVPLPDYEARVTLIENKLKEASHSLTKKDIEEIANSSNGFSGADLSILVRDSLMQPIREFQQATAFIQKHGIDVNGVERDGLWAACSSWNFSARKCSWSDLPEQDIMRPVANIKHFRTSVGKIRPTVSSADLKKYQNWTQQFGEVGT